MVFPARAALLIIDLQQAIDDPVWRADGERNNPQAEDNIAALLATWRELGLPRYHVRHDSTFESSPYRPDQPGHAFKPQARPLPGEAVIPKRTNSAFIGTGLEQTLRAAGIDTLVVGGVITNNSIEATVRMAGNLGFTTFLAEDAAFTFARRDLRGRLWAAEDVHALSLANLSGEYCTIQNTAQIIALARGASAPG